MSQGFANQFDPSYMIDRAQGHLMQIPAHQHDQLTMTIIMITDDYHGKRRLLHLFQTLPF